MIFLLCMAVAFFSTGNRSSMYSFTCWSDSFCLRRFSNSFPSFSIYSSAIKSVFFASQTLFLILPVCIMDQERLAVFSARFRVLLHTTRIGVRATFTAPLPSWVLLNTKYGEIRSPEIMYSLGSLANSHTFFPSCKAPAVS